MVGGGRLGTGERQTRAEYMGYQPQLQAGMRTGSVSQVVALCRDVDQEWYQYKIKCFIASCVKAYITSNGR